MNITLIDTTKSKFASYVPLALLRLSTMHKAAGDRVELIKAGEMPTRPPDKIYFSFIFLFDYKNDVRWCLTYRRHYPHATIKVGGISPTLIEGKFKKHFIGKKIEIFTGRDEALEATAPDYDMAGVDYSYGFTSRGCPNNCSWCVVPVLEGKQSKLPDWQKQVDTTRKKWFAFDNNVFACGAVHFKNVLAFCHHNEIKIDFNQGLDAEIFHCNKRIQAVFLKYPGVWQNIRFAWDSERVRESIIYTMDFLHEHKIKAVALKSLYMLYDADDTPEMVYERIQTVFIHPSKFEIKLMRFKDLDTGLLLRKWGGVGDLFAEAAAFVITGVISPGKFWNYMLAGDLNDFLKKASYIKEYHHRVKSLGRVKTAEFIKFAHARIYPSNVNNVKG